MNEKITEMLVICFIIGPFFLFSFFGLLNLFYKVFFIPKKCKRCGSKNIASRRSRFLESHSIESDLYCKDCGLDLGSFVIV